MSIFVFDFHAANHFVKGLQVERILPKKRPSADMDDTSYASTVFLICKGSASDLYQGQLKLEDTIFSAFSASYPYNIIVRKVIKGSMDLSF